MTRLQLTVSKHWSGWQVTDEDFSSGSPTGIAATIPAAIDDYLSSAWTFYVRKMNRTDIVINNHLAYTWR